MYVCTTNYKNTTMYYKNSKLQTGNKIVTHIYIYTMYVQKWSVKIPKIMER